MSNYMSCYPVIRNTFEISSILNIYLRDKFFKKKCQNWKNNSYLVEFGVPSAVARSTGQVAVVVVVGSYEAAGGCRVADA